MRRRLNRRGQSTLEYIIVWTAIVGALLGAVQVIKSTITNATNQASGRISTGVGDLVSGLN